MCNMKCPGNLIVGNLIDVTRLSCKPLMFLYLRQHMVNLGHDQPRCVPLTSMCMPSPAPWPRPSSSPIRPADLPTPPDSDEAASTASPFMVVLTVSPSSEPATFPSGDGLNPGVLRTWPAASFLPLCKTKERTRTGVAVCCTHGAQLVYEFSRLPRSLFYQHCAKRSPPPRLFVPLEAVLHCCPLYFFLRQNPPWHPHFET